MILNSSITPRAHTLMKFIAALYIFATDSYAISDEMSFSKGPQSMRRGPGTGSTPASILLPSFLYSSNNKYYAPWKTSKLIHNQCITIPTQGFHIYTGSTLNSSNKPKMKMADARIAIIGGGLCGITAAHAIHERLRTLPSDLIVEIVVYEADSNSFKEGMKSSRQGNMKKEIQPEWRAATCRNANSLVPGAAMHIMSRRSTLWKIAADSVQEILLRMKAGDARARDFSSVPPYFGFSLPGCLGWKVSWNERLCFVTFLFHFLRTSLLTGETEAVERGKIMVQLARANIVALDNYMTTTEKDLKGLVGLQEGFISVHRTKEDAIQAQKKVHNFGEEAELLTRNQALELEPQLAHLPLNDSYFVHRNCDRSADSAEFVQDMIRSLKCHDSFTYENKNGIVQNVTKVRSRGKQFGRRFQVCLSDGTINEFDHVILAAGILTPILASKISWRAGQSCPTFPLRGHSLTIFTRPKTNAPFLKKAISFDNMYCTSVAPNMVRIAGFGEIVGFPDGRTTVCHRVGPTILEKYAEYIFGSDAVSKIDGSTLPCFRPMSPDDVPLVGRLKAVPGLWIHSGHGTLGWTTSLATAHCLAQDICEDLMGVEGRSSYILPDGSSIHKSYVRPDRFRFSLFP